MRRPEALDLMKLRALIDDLDALGGRLRDRAAAADPEVAAEAARVVRAVIDGLGTSQTGLAPMIAVSDSKTVRDWCSGRMVPSRTALRAMRLLLERLVDPPPEGLAFEGGRDRSAPCVAALRPHLDRLAGVADAAGWTAGEVEAAVRSWLDARVTA